MAYTLQDQNRCICCDNPEGVWWLDACRVCEDVGCNERVSLLWGIRVLYHAYVDQMGSTPIADDQTERMPFKVWPSTGGPAGFHTAH